jgi:hypothetical protein
VIAPQVDAQRFELVANVLRRAVNNLLRASDARSADHHALVDAAAYVDWLIGQADARGVLLRAFDERVAAQINEQPEHRQPDAERAEREIAMSPRPVLPAGLSETHDLEVTRAAFDESEQILRWSSSVALHAAADRISELRAQLW